MGGFFLFPVWGLKREWATVYSSCGFTQTRILVDFPNPLLVDFLLHSPEHFRNKISFPLAIKTYITTENDGHLRLCVADELLKASLDSKAATLVFIKWCYIILHTFSYSSVVASWTSSLKNTGSKLLLNVYIDIFTILKDPGSNPLNNSRGVGGISQYNSLPWLLYLSLIYV